MRKIMISLPTGLFAAAAIYAVSSVALPAPAAAVVCAKGVYRAGCVGPNGAVAVRRPAARRRLPALRRRRRRSPLRRVVTPAALRPGRAQASVRASPDRAPPARR